MKKMLFMIIIVVIGFIVYPVMYVSTSDVTTIKVEN